MGRGIMNQRGGHNANQQARTEDDKDQTPSLEQELNIAKELQEIYEDSDDEMPINFEDANDLLEIFTSLEESNLLQIQRMQEAEQ